MKSQQGGKWLGRRARTRVAHTGLTWDESYRSGRFGASKRGGDDADLDVSPTAIGGSIAGAASTARRRSTPPTTPAAQAG
jgi:hypothetical protein